MGRSIKLCAARSYPSSLLARSLALAVVSNACLSYRLDGDTVHLVALMGDTFTFEYSTVTVEHLDPSRLVVLEQDARMRPRHKARTGPFSTGCRRSRRASRIASVGAPSCGNSTSRISPPRA